MSITVSGSDFLERYDCSIVGRLVSDDYENPLPDSAIAAHTNLTTAINDALGRFEAAVQSGGRYSIAELESLTTTSLAYAKKIICMIAMVSLMGRRPGTHNMEREQMLKESEGYLSALAAGKDVFTLTDHLEAGLLDPETTTEAVRLRRVLIADKVRGHLTTYSEDPPAS